VVELDDILRDALADLLAHATQYAPVTDESGAVAGVLSLEVIGRFLQEAPTDSPTGADLLADDPRSRAD